MAFALLTSSGDGDGDNEGVFTSYETHEVQIFSLS